MYSKSKINDDSFSPDDMVGKAVDERLKLMVKKQLSTNISLASQGFEKDNFTSPAILDNIKVSGLSSLDEFSRIVNENEEAHKLSQLGLSKSEVERKLSAKAINNSTKATKRRYGPDPIILKKEMLDIHNKTDEKISKRYESNIFGDQISVSRHVSDLLKSSSRNNSKMNLYNCLFTDKSNECSGDSNDPVNNLNSILQHTLEKDPIISSIDSMRKKTYFQEWSGKDTDVNHVQSDSFEPCHFEIESDLNNFKHTYPNSQWTEIKSENISKQQNIPKHFVSPCPITIIPREVISKYRLSVNEIRKISRFENYSEGVKSKTLYIKNLSPKVIHEDLISLFHQYDSKENESISCNLMYGRMKGQAFVTFSCEDIAEDALKLINGYHFKGKPIIIQYGKPNG